MGWVLGPLVGGYFSDHAVFGFFSPALRCSHPVEIHGIEHLERGYDALIDDLHRLGASIEFIQSKDENG